MKRLLFSNSQCVRIDYRVQYKSIVHEMRSGTYKWYDDFIKFPIYLEYACNAKGCSLGRIYIPFNTWTKEPLEVITFAEATKNKYI